MTGGHPHVQTRPCIHSWTWHEDVHFAENLEEHLRAYRHDPHGFWDMRNGNTRPTNLELKIWEWYEIVLKSDKKHRKHAKRVNPPWAFCLVTCTFENRISNCRWFQRTNDPSWSVSFICISWCVQPTEANQSPETPSCSLAILRNNVTPMGAVLKNITGRKSGPVAFT